MIAPLVLALYKTAGHPPLMLIPHRISHIMGHFRDLRRRCRNSSEGNAGCNGKLIS